VDNSATGPAARARGRGVVTDWTPVVAALAAAIPVLVAQIVILVQIVAHRAQTTALQQTANGTVAALQARLDAATAQVTALQTAAASAHGKDKQ